MAELVLSAVLPVLFEKLTSKAVKSIARYKGFDDEIEKWREWLKRIQRVLADASRKEITDDSVKDRLNKLQHLAYDIDDVLDDLATDAMHRKFTQDSEAIGSKVTMEATHYGHVVAHSSIIFVEIGTHQDTLLQQLLQSATCYKRLKHNNHGCFFFCKKGATRTCIAIN